MTTEPKELSTMDWAASDYVPPPRTTPKPQLVETCWRMKGPSGRLLECGIYRDVAPGFDVRCGYGDELMQSKRAGSMELAHAIADIWREAVLAKGGFMVVP